MLSCFSALIKTSQEREGVWKGWTSKDAFVHSAFFLHHTTAEWGGVRSVCKAVWIWTTFRPENQSKCLWVNKLKTMVDSNMMLEPIWILNSKECSDDPVVWPLPFFLLLLLLLLLLLSLPRPSFSSSSSVLRVSVATSGWEKEFSSIAPLCQCPYLFCASRAKTLKDFPLFAVTVN